jgi:hypothetical protein
VKARAATALESVEGATPAALAKVLMDQRRSAKRVAKWFVNSESFRPAGRPCIVEALQKALRIVKSDPCGAATDRV